MDDQPREPDLSAPESSVEHHRHHAPALAEELARIHERLGCIEAKLDDVLTMAGRISGRETRIMADLTQLDSAVEQLVAVNAAGAGELQTLADEVKTLTEGSITQAQIDAIHDKITAAATALADATSAAQAETEPPAGGGGAPIT